MKNLFSVIIFTFVIFTNSYSQQDVNGWYWLVGRPTGNTLNWTQIADPANIYAVGDFGTFMKSTDGGDTWSVNSQVGSPDNSSIGGLSTRVLNTGWFFDANTGMVAGQSLSSNSGLISRTTDGGNTWNYIQYNTVGAVIRDIYFINSLTGYMAGSSNAKLMKTTDAGLTWADQSTIPGFPAETNYGSVYALDTGNIFITSTNMKALYNYKTGIGWSSISLPGNFTIYSDILFKDANTGYISGNGNYFAYTTNGGTSWTQSNTSSNVGMHDMEYVNGVLYLAGNYSYIYKSTNNGVSWDSVYFRDNSNPNQPQTNSPGIIYGISVTGNDISLVGHSGFVNISNDGGSSWRSKNYSIDNNFGNKLYSSILVETAGTSNPATVGNIWLGPQGGGNLLFSSNGGVNWTSKPSPSISTVEDIQFVNANTGYICGGNSFMGIGEMSKTTNGGNSWTSVSLPSPINSYAIFTESFINANTGWIGGYAASSYKTTNGGVSWVPQIIETNNLYSIKRITMLDANTGYASSSSLYKTTNGGVNWIKNNDPLLVSTSWTDIFVYSKDVIYMNGSGNGGQNKIIRSVDGGVTWTDLTSNLLSTATIFRTKWLNLKHGIATGTNGYCAKTTDGGLSWTGSNPGGSTTVDCSIPSKNEWYAVSDRNSYYLAWRKKETLSSISLNVTLGIEGLWTGSSMVTDAVTVELRNAAFPYALVDQATEVVNYHGFSTFEFNNAPTGSYYAVLKHRNSLETWSAAPMLLNAAGNYSYNFTTSASQSFGSNTILKSGVYCNYSGDVNQDGIIDASDLATVENNVGNTGYLSEDVTGDDYVDAADVAIVENNQGVSVVAP
jgi:photosystem II stability/assembly factor-like uncharacterized protein